MIEVTIQYSHKGKPTSIPMGSWPEAPLVGDEIAAADGILIVQKRRWKVDAKAYERTLRVALMRNIKT